MELNQANATYSKPSEHNEWPFTTIGEVAAKVGSGSTPRGGDKVYVREGHPFIRSQNVGWGNLLLPDLAYINEETHSQFLSTEIVEGDVLLNITGASIGRSAIADTRISGGNVNQHVCIIRAISGKLHPQFLLYYLLSQDGQKQIDSFQAGGNRQGLNFQQIRSFYLPHPSLNEQVAISNVLADVDDLLAKLDQLIAKKSDIKKGAMQELLTGKRRLPGFSGNRMRTTLKSAGECLRGVSYKGNQDLYQDENQLSRTLLRSNNIQDGRVVFSDVQFVKQERVSHRQIMKLGDILICMANGSKDLVGKAAYFDEGGEKYTFGAFMGCFRVTCSAYSAKFIYFAFQSDEFRKYVSNILAGSSINNLRPRDIESAEFLFPPIDEQAAIAEVLTDISLEIMALEQKRNKVLAIKKAMMQQLLTGQIRLV
jgi:type I restriction enzyme S subunit